MSRYFSNNTNSLNAAINVSYSYTIADDRSQTLTWLSPLDPKLRHQDVQERRVPNVGEWLLRTQEFESWCAGSEGSESDNAVLFCYGDPGVGKTYIRYSTKSEPRGMEEKWQELTSRDISSLVIDLLCDQARGQNAAVACFYCDFATQKEQSPTNMLGALLKQAVGGLEEVPVEIAQTYEDQGKVIGGRGPQLADIVKMLQITSSKKRTFICIDALDECLARYRVKVLDSLNQVLQKCPGTRIFITGRPHVQPEISKRLPGRVKSVSITPRRDDIIGYLQTRLDEDTIPDAMDNCLEADILEKIPDNVSEIFLLVSLSMDAILQETTIHRRRERLRAMTDGLGLGNAYGATLDRIKGQGGERSRLGMATLMWISHAERPLKPDELCHALAVETGSPNLNIDNVPSIGTLLACCQGLVFVDKEASTVRLIHFTFQEYLRAHPELFGTPHSTIAETCLGYLNSQHIKALSASPPPNLQYVPFLEYSSLYWGAHAKRNLSDCAKSLALKLFDDCENCISTTILLRAQRPRSIVDFDKPFLFSSLHYASIFGIAEIVADLVEVEGCHVNQKDCMGNTSLMWAARGGHGGVMKILLGRNEVNPDKPDKYGQTPLNWAAFHGHEEVIKILLGRGDVNPDKPNVSGRTPLCCAAICGHEGVLKLLLGHDDVNPDKPDNRGQTPLCWAAENGHEEVVKILLGRDDVNPNRLDNRGITPLCRAALLGHGEVVKILLGRNDVNPDKPDGGSRTPLSCAAISGHEGVVKILLGRDDVNPDKPDEGGRTPLCWAATSGHEAVVKILLGRDDVNPDKPNNYGQTPLCRAAENGHEGVVKILLERDDVNPNKPDNYSQTPLYYAVQYRHAGTVALLRSQKTTARSAD